MAASPAILFSDARFLVINKPAGLPVHPGRAGGSSVEDYFPTWRQGRIGPWLAHRLDQDTAGCLVIALKKSALLAAQTLFFSGGGVEKTYWAVVHGTPKAQCGIITLPLAKITTGRSWKMQPDKAAPPAITKWRLLGQGANTAWLEFSPRTGRTHQIRAHAAAIGHPILGDSVYGGGTGTLHLLARHILLPLDPPVMAEAPVPDHMRKALESCAHVEK